MGSSERELNQRPEEEEVDLDADTKESTEDVFCDEETAESPHRIILWYKTDIAKIIADHFPQNGIHRQIGREINLGRNKMADVLLYEKHMARNFATITCRVNTQQKISFVLKNACDATKQKRIVITDAKGRVTELLPTQEVELLEGTTFKLECVEFRVGIELGDVNSRSFELVVKSVGGREGGSHDVNPQNNRSVDGGCVYGTGSVPGAPKPDASLDTAFIGLPLTNSIGSTMNPNEQVVPKYVTPALMTQNLGYGVGAAGGPAGALNMPSAMSPLYQGGLQAVAHPIGMNTYNPQLGYGYCDIQQPRSFVNQPSALHNPYAIYQQQNPTNVSDRHAQLLERGAGYQALSPDQRCACPHQEQRNSGHPASHGMSMSELAQALHAVSPQLSSSPRSIVTTPSTQDHSAVLYPSPANPRFRFPQAQANQMRSPHAPAGGRSPDLSDLPRGPPLAHLNGAQSIDLHPQIPPNMITTHAVTEVGNIRDLHRKDPVEHEDKPK